MSLLPTTHELNRELVRRRDAALLDALAAYVGAPVRVYRSSGDWLLTVEVAGLATAYVDPARATTEAELWQLAAVKARAAWWSYPIPDDPPNITRGDT